MRNNKKINVLYTPSDNYAASGAFLQMVDMIKEMEKKYNVNPLVVLPDNEGNGIELLKKENLRYVTVPSIDWLVSYNDSGKKVFKKKKKNIKRNIIAIIRLIKLIYKENIEIVHLNTIFTFVGAIAGIITKRKVIWHVREAIKPAFSKRIVFSWGYKLINCANKIISISKAVLNTYPDINKSKSVVIYDGIDEKKLVEKKCPIFSNKIIKMVCVGQIYTQKGQYELIDACAMLLENNIKNWHLTIIGSGAIEDIKNKISSLGMAKYVDVIGPKNNVHKYLANMDIGFTPSWFEGFGRTAAEIAMSGCLLICSDTGAFKEIYKDKKTAIFHKAQSYEDLYKAIKWAFDHLNECKKIAENGKLEILKKYTVSVNAKNVYKVYKEVLKGDNFNGK